MMTIKFGVSEDMAGLGLEVNTGDVSIRVGASKAELRRLLIDLYHEVGPPDIQGADDA